MRLTYPTSQTRTIAPKTQTDHWGRRRNLPRTRVFEACYCQKVRMKVQRLMEHGASTPSAEIFVPISEETRIRLFLFVIAVISSDQPKVVSMCFVSIFLRAMCCRDPLLFLSRSLVMRQEVLGRSYHERSLNERGYGLRNSISPCVRALNTTDAALIFRACSEMNGIAVGRAFNRVRAVIRAPRNAIDSACLGRMCFLNPTVLRGFPHGLPSKS